MEIPKELITAITTISIVALLIFFFIFQQIPEDQRGNVIITLAVAVASFLGGLGVGLLF